MTASALRILYAHPRLLGSIAGWSGLNDPDKQSWLIEHTKEMGFNAIWFSPFFETSQLEVERNGKKVSGSLYAITDHFHLGREFSASPAETDDSKRWKADDANIRHFTKQAADEGVTVMGDLVFDHVARDHPLALQENAQVGHIKETAKNIQPIRDNNTLVGLSYETDDGQSRNLYFKFRRNDDYTLAMPGVWTKKWDDAQKKNIDWFEAWDDVAQINYASPEAQKFFVTGENGQKGYWKQQIDWYLDRGFTGFRCDAAYMVPASVWSDLIQYAHNRAPDVVFMGETLGDNGQANALQSAKITINGKQREAFDLAMLPTYDWNFKDGWMIGEISRMQKIAHFGGAGFPDNLDTPHTVAEWAFDAFKSLPENQKNKVVADVCARNYAVAALIGNSVYMQLGYEYCRDRISVFREPQAAAYWKTLEATRGDSTNPLNLTARIRAINDFKEELHEAHAEVRLDKVSYCGDSGRLLKLECTLTHDETGRETGKVVIFVNERPEDGPIKIREKDLENGMTANFNRLALGDESRDPDHICEIADVAAFYQPLPGAEPPIRPDLPLPGMPPPAPAP